MSGCLPLALQQWLRIPGLSMMGAGEEGGSAEPHTCQMICHYRGVSSQLSPSNHPSYPSSRPPLPSSLPKLRSSPPKTPSAFLWQLGFHSQRCYPICPSFSTIDPERKCTPAGDSEHIVWMCMLHVCVSTKCECLPKGRAVCIDAQGKPPEQNLTSGEHVNLQSRNKTPADKHNTECSHRYTISVNDVLSSPQVTGHALFH